MNPRPSLRSAAAKEQRNQTKNAFLDAAERLLVGVGYAGITTRLLAATAGANQGLVHYYFGSLEEVFLQVLDRFTARLIARQKAMYEADLPFLEKWRTAWRFQEDDLSSGYNKIWLELQAMAWNHPAMRARVAAVNGAWRGVLRAAFSRALEEYGVDEPLEPLVALTMTFAIGYQIESVSGIREGHRALLAWIDGWMEGLARRASHGRRGKTGRKRGKPGDAPGPAGRGRAGRRTDRVGGLRPR